jgi:2-keto-4-pentenoate hydratase/2-oxohepta-3-ene-1,7-dioic acid hydratase in catechol pathway
VLGRSQRFDLAALGEQSLDYEVELAVIIGRRCRRISSAEAQSAIAGFTVANDLTLRERVRKSITLAKAFETHTPIGPWIVTPDEIEGQRLRLRSWVNGELRQDSTTAEMIVPWPDLIAELSASFVLNPGDVLLTGTPSGCGVFHRPPRWLRAGDRVRLEIEGIGTLENQILDEPA